MGPKIVAVYKREYALKLCRLLWGNILLIDQARSMELAREEVAEDQLDKLFEPQQTLDPIEVTPYWHITTYNPGPDPLQKDLSATEYNYAIILCEEPKELYSYEKFALIKRSLSFVDMFIWDARHG